MHLLKHLVCATAVLLLTATQALTAEAVKVDRSRYAADSPVIVRQEGDQLRVSWPVAEGEYGVLAINLSKGGPLISELGIAETDEGPSAALLRNVDPVTFLTVGERDLSEQGWMVFFDNPRRRPYETFRASLDLKSARIESHGQRCTIVLDELSAGTFRGSLQFTLYPDCRLVHVHAVLSTDENARAILYDAGIVSQEPAWKTIAWIDTQDQLQRMPATEQTEAAPVAVRNRAIVAESDEGAVAILPPPHQYLYPLDFSDNFKFTWHGRGFHGSSDWGFGVRQPPEGDNRFVPWMNARPGAENRLGVFYLFSRGDASDALAHVRQFTRGDRYKKLDGYRTFTSHYHVEHTLDFLARQREQKTMGVPEGLEEPPFVRTFKSHGVDIVHLAEFHVAHTPDFIEQRLQQLATLHDECRRLSNDEFLLLPGEEPNVHLGGHWISFFPRPVYWLLHPKPGTPFLQETPNGQRVYAVHNADDVLKLMEAEGGLMWTAHPRTKSSFGFPDRYRREPFFRSDRFLGAAWKAMPADASLPRLGVRGLDLLDDMANWGDGPKYLLGEVDVFKVMPDHELYGHMNINYLRLDRLPQFDDGWQPVLDALREGRFFVSTGEVLLPDFRVAGKSSGDTIELGDDGRVDIVAQLEWTFPPAFAEIIWGDGETTHRHRIDLADQPAFAETTLRFSLDIPTARWLRLEAWDVAANGAFTQPVWVAR